MGQEFIIKSQQLEDKINQLLPSQGGFQAGVDLSASTTVIPIVDLTESAEGSQLRQDLQTSLSLISCTPHNVSNTTTTVVTTTGYYRIFGNGIFNGSGTGQIQITDGTTTKTLFQAASITGEIFVRPYDFVVKIEAGDSLQIVTNEPDISLIGTTRQIADLAGNLTNP